MPPEHFLMYYSITSTLPSIHFSWTKTRHLSTFHELIFGGKFPKVVLGLGIFRVLVGSFYRTPLPPRWTRPKHSCGAADIVSNTKEVSWPGLEPGSPAIAAVALPTELPLHDSGMRQITATQQPYHTIPNRPNGGLVWIWTLNVS